MQVFNTTLEKFAAENKERIKEEPSFRGDFYTMCQEIGVDPLASKSMWNKNLNLTEFYYELAVLS